MKKRTYLLPILAAVTLCVAATPRTLPYIVEAAVRAPQGGTLRVTIAGEQVPVVNEDGPPVQLRVFDANNMDVRGTGWRSDSLDVASVDAGGMLRGWNRGFATIYATANGITAKAIVAVMRVTSEEGARVEGDTKEDTAGRRYSSKPDRHVIMRTQALAGAQVWVGTSDSEGFEEGMGQAARFRSPSGLDVDLSGRGALYVADSRNHCVRRVGLDGMVGRGRRGSVVAGRAEVAGTSTGTSPIDLDQLRLREPQGVVSAGGSVYIADTENHCIWFADVEKRKAWLVAGLPGQLGSSSGSGTTARFNRPTALAVNTRRTLLAVADTGNNAVRLIRLERTGDGGVVGRVSTLGVSSSGKVADVERAVAFDDSNDAITFTGPRSVGIDGAENVYVVDDLGASVVTRPTEATPVPVALAQQGTFARAVSVNLMGARAVLVDAGASDDQVVREVTVGAPTIETVTPDSAPLAGNVPVVIRGSNFAPESIVTIGDTSALSIDVTSASEIRCVVPRQSVPGARTISVVTRGGIAQSIFGIESMPLSRLASDQIGTVVGGVSARGDGGRGIASGVRLTPYGVAIDGTGNLFIADRDGNRVRRFDSATGIVTTVAGNGSMGSDGDEGQASAARLNQPRAVAVDASGNLFIADTANNKVRRVDGLTGVITTVAGTGEEGSSGDGNAARLAKLWLPAGVAVDLSGNVFIADTLNDVVRRIDSTGKISRYAGGGSSAAGEGVPATQVRLRQPGGLAVDGDGNLYIADTFGYRVRRVDASTKRIVTVAGNGVFGVAVEGAAATQTSVLPNGVAVDESGSLFVTTAGRVLYVDAVEKRIQTIVGDGLEGFGGDEGLATAARCSGETGIAVDAVGNVYFADTGNLRVRRVDAVADTIDTVVGTSDAGFLGDGGKATRAGLRQARGVAVDAHGNVFVSDELNNRVRRVDVESGIVETYAGTGVSGDDGDGGPATLAQLASPRGLAVDGAGNLYIADANNSSIRRVSAGTREIDTIAAQGLFFPSDIAIAPDGSLVIADTSNNRVVRVDPATGVLEPIAGTGVAGFSDDRPATTALLNGPQSVAVASNDDVYIADSANNVVRRVDAATDLISTVAGNRNRVFNGDGIPARSAAMWPFAVSLDGLGNLFIADYENDRVRRVNLTSGIVTTVAGDGTQGYAGDDGDATKASLRGPQDVFLGEGNNLYIADTFNNAVRVVRDVGEGVVSTGPLITLATYAKPILTIAGVNFGATRPAVRINGVDVSGRIQTSSATSVTLKGGPKKLALRTGANEIRIVVDGLSSNSFTLDR